MKPLLHVPALVGMVLVTAALLACADVSTESQINSAPPAATASTPIPPAAPAATPGWVDILETASAPEGWQVVPCEAPLLLCVTANGEFAGTVERASYSLSDIELAATVEPTAGAEIEFLQAWVAEHYAAIQADRQIGDGSLIFTTEPPTEISVGGLPGLRYSFAATHANGTLANRYVGYVTTDGERLHIFVTGVIRGDYGGVFGDSDLLTEFEPYLDDIIRNLSLSETSALGLLNPYRTAIAE